MTGIGSLQGNLYKLILPKVHSPVITATCSTKVDTLTLWHRRIGNSPPHVLKHISQLHSSCTINTLFVCDTCHFLNKGDLVFLILNPGHPNPLNFFTVICGDPTNIKLMSIVMVFL